MHREQQTLEKGKNMSEMKDEEMGIVKNSEAWARRVMLSEKHKQLKYKNWIIENFLLSNAANQ